MTPAPERYYSVSEKELEHIYDALLIMDECVSQVMAFEDIERIKSRGSHSDIITELRRG